MNRRALRDYQALLARTQTVHRPVGPLAYDGSSTLSVVLGVHAAIGRGA